MPRNREAKQRRAAGDEHREQQNAKRAQPHATKYYLEKSLLLGRVARSVASFFDLPAGLVDRTVELSARLFSWTTFTGGKAEEQHGA